MAAREPSLHAGPQNLYAADESSLVGWITPCSCGFLRGDRQWMICPQPARRRGDRSNRRARDLCEEHR